MSDRRPDDRLPNHGRLAIGAALTVLGLALWIVAGFVGRGEARSYEGDAAPPAYVTVTAGHTYSIGTVGGLSTLRPIVDPSSLQCTIGTSVGEAAQLPISVETNDKALHRIATFVAPQSGRVHVACADAGDVYVDDPDGSVDGSGMLRLLATVLLAVGLPLGLSGLASLSVRREPVAPPL